MAKSDLHTDLHTRRSPITLYNKNIKWEIAVLCIQDERNNQRKIKNENPIYKLITINMDKINQFNERCVYAAQD